MDPLLRNRWMWCLLFGGHKLWKTTLTYVRLSSIFMTVLKTKMIPWSCSKCKVLFEDVILKDDSALFFAALWYMNMCYGEAIREQSKADTHRVLSLASTLTINIYTRSYIIYIYIYNYLGVFNTDDWFINDLLCCVFQVCCEFSRIQQVLGKREALLVSFKLAQD